MICERFSPSFLGLSGHPSCSSFAVLFPAFSGSETDLISGVLRLPKRNLSADEFRAAEFVLIGLLRRVSQESSDEAKSERKIGRICPRLSLAACQCVSASVKRGHRFAAALFHTAPRPALY